MCYSASLICGLCGKSVENTQLNTSDKNAVYCVECFQVDEIERSDYFQRVQRMSDQESVSTTVSVSHVKEKTKTEAMDHYIYIDPDSPIVLSHAEDLNYLFPEHWFARRKDLFGLFVDGRFL